MGFFDVSAWDKAWGLKYEKYDPDRKLDFTKDVSDKSLKFELIHCSILPSEEKMKENIKKRIEKFARSIEKGFRFPCELKCNWPGVKFELYFDENITEQISCQVEAEFNAYIKKRNRYQVMDGREIIRCNMIARDDVENPNPNVVYVFVDFADASHMTLQKLLNHLDKSDLDIKKIVLNK